MTPAEKSLCVAGRAYSRARLQAHGIVQSGKSRLSGDELTRLVGEQRAQEALQAAAMALGDEDATRATRRRP